MCSFNTYFTAQNIYHWIMNIGWFYVRIYLFMAIALHM